MATTPINCPCRNACKERRESAVNTVLRQEICTSAELRNFLKEDFGDYTIRKSVNFLCSNICCYIKAFRAANELKPTMFGRQGKLFYVKDLPEERLKLEIRERLSGLQKRLLEKFSALNRGVFYFSMYDLKRLIPAPGSVVEYSVKRLIKLGIIRSVHLGHTDFFVLTSQVSRMQTDEDSIVINDLSEFAVINIVHELIMNLYPPNIMMGYYDAIRPRTRETLAITGGMSFDIFYRFRENSINRKYLAVDVYTRYPVTGYTVNSFVKKIDWAKTREKGKITNNLTGNTYGMMVFRIATPGAIRKANSLGIRFLRLSDLKIDYPKLLEKVKTDFLKKSIE